MTRGQYSPNGAYPQDLPDYWKFSDGVIRTDLPELSDEELEELGWYGPIDLPPFEGTNYYTHEYTWNKDTISFDVRQLDPDERARRINYTEFWNKLIETTAYEKIKNEAKMSLEVNVYCTEFIALITDAKMKNVNMEKIQESITNIFSNVEFTLEELQEIQQIFMDTGMTYTYNLS